MQAEENGPGFSQNGGGPLNGGVHPTLAPVYAPAVQMEVPSAERAGSTFDVKRWILESLRGRYLIAVGLGVVCGGLLAGVAWKFVKPVYHSEGLVRIAYTMPEVMTQTDQNAAMPQFDTFMLSQRLLITSRRVIDMAIQDPIWKATGRLVPATPDRYFAEHLKVDIRPRSEFIEIAVQDENPGTAAAAVTSVINAYQQLYDDQDKHLSNQRLGVLDDQQNTLQAKIDGLRKQLRAGAQDFGTTKLDQFYDAQVAELTKLDAALAEVRLAIATAPKSSEIEAAPTTQPVAEIAEVAPSKAVTPSVGDLPDISLADQIGAYDLQMRGALDEESRKKEYLDRLILKGMGENHPSVKMARADVDSATERVKARLKFQQEFHAAAGHYMGEPVAAAGGPGGAAAAGRNGGMIATGRSVAQLKVAEASLVRLREQTQKEMVALGNKEMDLNKLNADLASATDEYQKLSSRMESLRREASLGGRLTIITSGEIPLSPDTDPRFKVVPAGLVFGFCLPAGCFLLMGLAKRQYRYSNETENDIMPEMPFLGVLPELGAPDASGERSLAAAHAVHQIRVSIQSQMRNGGTGTYLITSATAGEGKTGLTMALGLSFAAARMRTLVIDCDMIGRHLTNRLEAKGSPGLSDALEAGSIENLYHQLDGGLAALTVGQGTAADAYGISAASIRAILDDARQKFDVVIVDTGPILGSVEAAVLAQEVDGVILTVSRGRDRAMVRNAMRRLHTLGARSIGFVFNRAATTDFEQSAYSSTSLRTSPTTDLSARPNGAAYGERRTRLKEFGPLVDAVASGVPDEN